MGRAVFTSIALFVLGAVAFLALRRGDEAPPPALEPSLELPPSLSALLVGAVPEPSSAEVQIEQDLELAQRVFGGLTVTLFGAGPGKRFVAERREEPERGIRQALAALFSSHSGARSFHAPRIEIEGPATVEALDLVFGHARAAEPPLPLLYVAGHGVQGDVLGGGAFTLWGDALFTPSDLVAWLMETHGDAPLRIVATTCYSGAFAEIIFDDADESLGPARDVHCGLFATTSEDEASGCDPRPDRARQEGFGIHFLHALRGISRDGSPLPRADLDGDGAVSLLEAHAHARVLGRSIDVPTLTSERFLRYAVTEDEHTDDEHTDDEHTDDEHTDDEHTDDEHTEDEETDEEAAATGEDPIEVFVVESLSRALSLPSRRAAEAALVELERALDVQAEELMEASSRSDEAFLKLRATLLEIVPFVDDPWNPRWEAEIDAHAAALSSALEQSDAAEALRVASTIEASIEAGIIAKEAERARVKRLVRAHENLALSGALVAAGGDALDRYLAIRECERFTPPLAVPSR